MQGVTDETITYADSKSEAQVDHVESDTEMDKGYQAKVDRLENRVKELEDTKDNLQMAQTPPPKKRTDWKGGLEIIGSIAALLFLVGGIMWWAHSELMRINDRMDSIDKRMARLETAIRILSVGQGGNTKELVDEALKVAQARSEAGNTESASRILAIADKMISENKARKTPADPSFFNQSIVRVRNIRRTSQGSPALAADAFKATVELAEYRSAITTPPTDFHPQHEYGGQRGVYIGEMTTENGYLLLKDAALYGPNAILRGSEGGFLIDGYRLENVVLSGLTIHYHGGPVVLQNVWFVNCTFIVQQSGNGTQLLEVAALAEPTAKIG